jgi:hypothetical protein
MPEITVSPETYHQLTLLASWEGTSKGEVVARLLSRLPAQGGDPAPADHSTDVPVYKVYERKRVEGLFDPAAKTLSITTEPLSGEVFNRPSSAAISVVEHFKPGSNPNRNGWDFWRVTATDEPLSTLRNRR